MGTIGYDILNCPCYQLIKQHKELHLIGFGTIGTYPSTLDAKITHSREARSLSLLVLPTAHPVMLMRDVGFRVSGLGLKFNWIYVFGFRALGLEMQQGL